MIRLAAVLAILAGLAGLLPPLAIAAASAEAGGATAPKVRVELLSEVTAVAPGKAFWVGLRQEIAPGWHTYWSNPGDSGEPTRIEWALPAGFAAGAIAWPHPERIPVGPAMSYGYSREVVLPILVTAPADLAPGARIALRGRASWLVCEKVCIPEESAFELPLSVAAGPPAPDPRGAPMIAQARGAVPAPSPWPASFSATKDTVTFTVAARGLSAERLAEAWFFPARWGVIEHAAPQRMRVGGAGLILEVARGQLPEATAEPIDGVLVLAERIDAGTARHAFAIRALPAGGAAGAGMLSLLQALGLALAGGLVLNLMPCVLPVLSVKALGLLQHASERPGVLRRHGAVHTAGVLASFAVLAGALLALRAAGEQVGWGFQLQSPAFVALLAYVLFAMALSLSGLLLIGGRLAGAGAGLAARSGYAGSFFTGALTTVAATPCTAPFMGAAVGFAVTQSWSTALLVFEALGLGLALPYLALTLVPGWRRFLPRPGAWMERLKHLLAVPLYASVAWLAWVLQQQAGPAGVAACVAGLALVAGAAWLHRASRAARPRWRSLATAAVVALALGAAASGALAGSLSAPPLAQEASAGWETFSPRRLADLRAQGKPVFVNVTAAWCITCLVNERVALRSPAVAQAFARKGVVALKADWTSRDPAITAMLGSFGRSGVPLYLVYPPPGSQASGEPTVLPQILSEGAVIAIIDEL